MKELLGYIAATLTTFSFLPQVIKIIQHRSVKDISLIMYIFFSVGIVLWLIYGIMMSSLPMILANTITLMLNLVIIYLKLTIKS
jgi:MtN3 and saliva related transmembrane protein